MKTRRRFIRNTALVAAAVVGPARIRAAEFEYKLGHDVPVSTSLGAAANEFAAAVRRETNGRLNVKVFPESALGGDASMVTQLRSGALEMHLQGNGALSSVAPICSIGFLGFAYTNRKQGFAAMDGAVGAAIRQGLEAKDLIVFERPWSAGFHELTCSAHPIRTPDDMANLKMRVPLGTITVDLFHALGVSAVSVDFALLYSSLQTHLVDGTSNVTVNVWATKIYEVQKYLSLTNHFFSIYWFLMNPQAWGALPSDIQEVVRRNANLYGIRQRRQDELQATSAADFLRRYGMVINPTDPDSFRTRLGAYYAKWRNEFGAQTWTALEGYTGKLG